MIEAICPKCEKVNEVGDELIGRYTICDKCRCRFYVYVPSLEKTQPPTAARLRESPTAATTLDDLLLDNQQGDRHVMKILSEQQRVLARTNLTLITLTVLAAANLVCLIVLLSR